MVTNWPMMMNPKINHVIENIVVPSVSKIGHYNGFKMPLATSFFRRSKKYDPSANSEWSHLHHSLACCVLFVQSGLTAAMTLIKYYTFLST